MRARACAPLAAEPDLNEAGEARNYQVAFELAKALHPHVVRIDVDMLHAGATMTALCSNCHQAPAIFLAMSDYAGARTPASDGGTVEIEPRSQLHDTLPAAIRHLARQKQPGWR